MMKTDAFYQLVEKLHEELIQPRTINKDLRVELLQIQKDIEAILSNKQDLTKHHRQRFIQKLRKVVDDFEISHPELTEKLGRIADSLGRIGI